MSADSASVLKAPPRAESNPVSRGGAHACVTCGTTLAGTYCWNCGEKLIEEHDYSLRHFLTHALEAFTHFDTNALRSLKDLVTKPGKLTADYIAGRRKSSVAPLQLFLVINVAYFLVQPLLGWNTLTTSLAAHLNDEFYSPLARHLVEGAVAKKSISLALFEERFDEISTTHAKSLVIIMVPMLALALDAVFHRSRRYYVEHLFFSLHFYSAWLIVTTAMVGLTNGVLTILTSLDIPHPWQAVEGISAWCGYGILGAYMYLACRLVYKEGPARLALKTAGLLLALVYILRLYRFILFFTTLWSI